MTLNQAHPNPIVNSAADRVREFVQAYGGGPPSVILRTLTATKGIDLTIGDLTILIAQADHLRHVDDTAHRVIENGACHPGR